MIVLNGVAFGLVIAVLIGPVFFALLHTSIEKGFKKAVLVALGIALSDICYISVIYFGLSKFLQNAGYNHTLTYAGVGILWGFGIFYLIKSRRVVTMKTDDEPIKGTFRFILKGFFINGISPFVLIFWLGAMSIATIEYGYENDQLVLFFGIVVTTVFLTDLIKAYLAHRLRVFMTPRFFKILNVVMGLALIGFGVRMLVA